MILSLSVDLQPKDSQMNIVVEGPDNSGKSTLVDKLSHVLNMRVLHSDGPVKQQEEMHSRCLAYLNATDTIFDRHCIVSERIYGMMRGHVMLDPVLEGMFYDDQQHLIIYCRNTRGLSSHVMKQHDTQQHLTLVSSRHKQICDLYDKWALRHAHLMYRIGDDTKLITKIIEGLCK